MKKEEFRARIDYSEEIKKQEEKKNRIIDFVMLPTRRELTQDEKEKYMSINKDEIPEGIMQSVYGIIKEAIETGEVDYKSKVVSRLVELEQVPEQFRVDPNKEDKLKLEGDGMDER